MQKAEVITHLRHYLVSELLEGDDIGLDEHTPLLAWNIINSLEMVNLLAFIYKKFAVEIAPDDLIAENFVNLSAIADLVLKNTVSKMSWDDRAS